MEQSFLPDIQQEQMVVNKRVLIPGDQKYFPHRGQRVTVHYTAAVSWDYLHFFHISNRDHQVSGGDKFDCPRENGDPFIFRVGSGEVIRGWEQVIQTVRFYSY